MLDYQALKDFGRREFGSAYPWELDYTTAGRDEKIIIALWWQAMAQFVDNAQPLPDDLKGLITNG